MPGTRASKYIQRAMKRMLVHTYTLTDTYAVPVLDVKGDPTYDEWGNQLYTDVIDTTVNPCLFLWEDIITETERGRIVLKQPTLYVKHNDMIGVNDTVTNVRSANGTLLLEAATVNEIDSTAEFGDSTVHVLRLRGAVTV